MLGPDMYVCWSRVPHRAAGASLALRDSMLEQPLAELRGLGQGDSLAIGGLR